MEVRLWCELQHGSTSLVCVTARKYVTGVGLLHRSTQQVWVYITEVRNLCKVTSLKYVTVRNWCELHHGST